MDDDIEMELWMEMSEAEQDAALATAEAQHIEWWNSLTPLQQYRSCRGRAVENMRRFRAIVLPAFPFLASEIKARQISMVKLRYWRRTGIYPGEA